MAYRTEKADSDSVRRQNRQLIVETIRRAGPASRTELSERTGLSSASMSDISRRLCQEGLLLEVPAPRRSTVQRGRPQVQLRINPGFSHVVAAQVTVKEIGVAIADYSGAVVATHRKSIAGQLLDASALVDAVVGEVSAAVSVPNLADNPYLRVQVAVQGIVDAAKRNVLWTPFLTERNIDLATPLEAALGAPSVVVNDCTSMVEGLNWIDPDQFQSDFAVVLVGYGVGMGLYINRRAYSGQRSSAAELGHTNHRPGGALCRCGKSGCVEAYAADYAIWRAANGLKYDADPANINPSELEMVTITNKARAGDPAAVNAFREAGRAIGYGLGRMFTVTDPLKVVFTGSGMRGFDLLEPFIQEGYAESLVDALMAPLSYQIYNDESALVFKGAIMSALTDLDRDVVFSRSSSSVEQTVLQSPVQR